ncbi:hypothetical protein [Psychroserpens jangbogonensis]|uniref:hypothetical protein n=1 Tax=Psychroserpens jangbogonensis TaxID=1484460 RepID=UPI00053ED346|nr:hypothetical protein [Psychroserpens jangbogonensis]
MTSGLRKAHKFIWLLLIIIVPVIMFLSVKDLDVFSSKDNTSSTLEGSKKVNLKSFENDIVKTSVFESHLEIILKSTLKNSSSVVYEMDEKGNKPSVIGQITTAGIYNFEIKNLPKGIIIYDDLKNIEITKFSFQWD